MRFSIIIPVYNVEKYIGKCMESVMNQTFSDYEVIVVNDETPDNSMAVVQEYVNRYPDKIQVIHQKNTRQGGARNHGVKYAQGEYILFVDSDDYISEVMLETVDAHLKADPCDILVFRNIHVSEDGSVLGKTDFGILKPGKYIPRINKEILLLQVGPVNKAYRREFYVDSGFLFPEKLLYEDNALRLLFAKAESIDIVDDALYYYVQTSNSTMRQKVSEKMLDITKIIDIIYYEFEKHGLLDTFREMVDYTSILTVLYMYDMIIRMDPSSNLRDRLVDYIAERFSDYRTYPLLHRGQKKRIAILLKRKYRFYYFCFIWLYEIKVTLLKR